MAVRLMSLELASLISWPLVGIFVSWAILLFLGLGVLSRLNATSVGAFGVASAILLILGLNQPLSGLFRIPARLDRRHYEGSERGGLKL